MPPRFLYEHSCRWFFLLSASPGFTTNKRHQCLIQLANLDCCALIALVACSFKDRIENIHFSVRSAYSLDFEDCQFDVAICSNALHCMDIPEKALLEIRRVIKDNGILIAPTFCHGVNWRSRLLSRIMSLTGFKSYHKFRIGEFFDLLTSCGFKIIKKDISNDFIPLAYVVARSISS